jgi:exodeoxyribonuclease VII large subunit
MASPSVNTNMNLNLVYNKIEAHIASEPSYQNLTLEVEVSELKVYKLVYLKILEANCKIDAVIFPKVYNQDLVDGDKIQAKGKFKLYSGKLQFNIESYVKMGTGASSLSLTKLTAEFEAKGYFNPETKPVIGMDYQKIAIISSLNAAGLKDFLHTLNSRTTSKKLFLYPASVQGLSAVQEIPQALALAQEHAFCEIIVLIRGGGSKDDLSCFNSREIVEAIYQSKIPVVTGIGHQIDTSLSDLTAAKSFITPTATAQELFTQHNNVNINAERKISYENLRNQIINKLHERATKINSYVERLETELQMFSARSSNLLTSTKNLLNMTGFNLQTQIMNMSTYLRSAIVTLDSSSKAFLQNRQIMLNIVEQSLNKKGSDLGNCLESYSHRLLHAAQPTITTLKGRVIKSVDQILEGQVYVIKFSDGLVKFSLN